MALRRSSLRPPAPLAVLLLVGLLPALAAPSAAATPTPQSLAADYRAATLGAKVEPFVPPAPGHLKLRAAAPAATVVDGTGRAIGWQFEEVDLVWEIDPADLAVLKNNLDEIHALSSAIQLEPLSKSGAELRIAAKSVAWISLSGSAEPGTPPATRPPATGALERALSPGLFEPELDFATHRLAGTTGALFVVAELGAGKAVFYSHDPMDGDESLLFARPSDSVGFASLGYPEAELLDRRPIGRGRREIPRLPAEVRRIDVELTEEADELGRGIATLDFGFPNDSPAVLRLQFAGRRSEIITDARVRTIRGKVDSVRLDDGTALPFACGQDGLVVSLPRAPRRGESLRLKFDYTTPLLRYEGNQYWRLVGGAWFPQVGNGFRTTWAPFHAKILARKPLLPMATGREVRRWETETHNGLEVEEKRSISFPAVSAGRYFPHRLEDERQRSIQLVAYAIEKPGGQKTLAKLAADTISLYELIFPPYPFQSLSVVEANSFGWGQAPSAFINITKEAFSPGYTVEHRYYSQAANEIYAHEIAHGWWGHMFRVISEEDQWLEESFAEYASGLFLDMARDKDDLDRMSKRWKGQAKQISGLSIVSANRLSGTDAGWKRWLLLYNKGPWVLHCLRSEMDDKTFLTVLKSFLRSFDGKAVRTDDFRGLLEFITKKDWKEWFEKYVYGTEMPALKREIGD